MGGGGSPAPTPAPTPPATPPQYGTNTVPPTTPNTGLQQIAVSPPAPTILGAVGATGAPQPGTPGYNKLLGQ